MSSKNLVRALAVSTLALAANPAIAQQKPLPKPPIFYQTWMNPEVKKYGWDKGFTGKGANITVIDYYSKDPSNRYKGNLTGKKEDLSHGEWSFKHASLIAPGALVLRREKIEGRTKETVQLQKGFNILNASYGVYFENTRFRTPKAAYNSLNIFDQSVVNAGVNGKALVVLAAGNDSAVVGQPVAGKSDAMNRAFMADVGKGSILYVGALDKHGSRKKGGKAAIASYSNKAGDDARVNSRFVMVGVPGATGLDGTSFAAPVVSGYAAILHSKFQKATPTQISNQILRTARKDTISGYNLNIHGQGEASLARALSPKNIK